MRNIPNKKRKLNYMHNEYLLDTKQILLTSQFDNRVKHINLKLHIYIVCVSLYPNSCNRAILILFVLLYIKNTYLSQYYRNNSDIKYCTITQ